MPDDHPRPDFRRDTAWGRLDGRWDFARSSDPMPPERWPETIMVPFGWDTAASGLNARWLETGWYRLRWAAPTPPEGHRLIVHFGAVQHEGSVFVGDRLIGRHVGGQLPFEVDLTDSAGRTVDLCVRASNPHDKGAIPHGKQRSIPVDPYDSCAFSPCSGIWQSVWWEFRPEFHIAAVDLRPRATLDGWDATVQLSAAPPDSASVTVLIKRPDPVEAPGQKIPEPVEGPDEEVPEPVEGRSSSFFDKLRTLGDDDSHGSRCFDMEIVVDDPQLWTPETPHLYELVVELRDGDRLVDRVIVTGGIRVIETRDGRLFLNGERIFLRGVLDQGYWPDHGWTAPDRESLIADLDHARRLGFNLVRKHLKLEDPRWLHHADRIGMLVWEEPASTSRFGPDAAAAFADQLVPMVARDRNHPSIVIWGLYNEEWGLDWDVVGDPAKQQVLREAYELIKKVDDSRPVVDCSGWSHVATDLADWHVYSDRLASWKQTLVEVHSGTEPGFDVDLGIRVERKYLMADRGGAGGLPLINSEYGTGRTAVDRAWAMRWQTQELRRAPGNNGYVYTELYDVEHEFAGILTEDRAAKDDLGLSSADVHAETVIITDLEPVAPGIDLITGTDTVAVTVLISHHGSCSLSGALVTGWSMIGTPPGAPDAERGVRVTVEPFVLSAPATVRATMPQQARAARLHVWLVGDDGRINAHTVLDVVRTGDDGVAGPDR